MHTVWKMTIWQQFGASIDMLENAIRACTPEVWGKRSEPSEFWYIASHTLFWLDFYLTEDGAEFAPPAPFGLEELDPAGVIPARAYSPAELLTYLEYGRNKCRAAIQRLTDDSMHQPCGTKRSGLSNVELLLYNMRHVQHHAAQLNLLLRQRIDSAPDWVGKTKKPLA